MHKYLFKVFYNRINKEKYNMQICQHNVYYKNVIIMKNIIILKETKEKKKAASKYFRHNCASKYVSNIRSY